MFSSNVLYKSKEWNEKERERMKENNTVLEMTVGAHTYGANIHSRGE